MKYRCIVVDPPWPQQTVGRFKNPRHGRPGALPYKTMTQAEIATMDVVRRYGEVGVHAWLWTTNSHLRDAFDLFKMWDVTYLNTITWIKPSGFGAWFANTTQHCLFGYYQRCEFPLGRWKPTHFKATPKRHSEKPDEFYDLVRSISPSPRLDMFARRVIEGFDGWGDEYPPSNEPSNR